MPHAENGTMVNGEKQSSQFLAVSLYTFLFTTFPLPPNPLLLMLLL